MEPLTKKQQELAESNIKLANWSLYAFRNHHWYFKRSLVGVIDNNDIKQEQMLTLVRAASKWNPDRGTKFSSYAVACLKKMPHLYTRMIKLRSKKSSASVFDVDKGKEEELPEPDRYNVLYQSLSILSDRERYIIKERFGLNRSRKERTLKEIGKIFGVSRERIRQIQARALNKLRIHLEKMNGCY